MKFDPTLDPEQVCAEINAQYFGDKSLRISGLNEIHLVEKGDITFVDHPKYYKKALSSNASFILINKKVEVPEGKGILVSDDPFRDFNRIILKYRYFSGSSSSVSSTSVIGENTVIQPGAFVGHNVKIGKNCIIHANASIYDHSQLGDNVIIHSGTVIGADAFYFQRRSDKVLKFQTCGRVILGDYVEIGAGCTIDKGVTGDTMIGDYTKFDNQIHIGHDVKIGKRCLVAAGVVVAGIVEIENDVIIWGRVVINKELKIGKGAVIMATSGVGNDLEGGKVYFGTPAIDARKQWREIAMIKKLPEMYTKLNDILKKMPEG
ncbi:MAG: UDP-3-O-(3-hydroxymyristoyl)glucosamine N-acyltransferase [Bacteroidales bacterium]|nr:UDP-3-O-(3-hydroxymyristoyl)glucosamine N-acyltransferase [Bacteroidales bacterium]